MTEVTFQEKNIICEELRKKKQLQLTNLKVLGFDAFKILS